MKIKLGVIFGGETVEHEVSIISALQAIENIDKEKYEVIPIYIGKDRTWYTGHILLDVNTYKTFNDSKRYLKKVVLYKKDDMFLLQSTTGLFRKDIADLDALMKFCNDKVMACEYKQNDKLTENVKVSFNNETHSTGDTFQSVVKKETSIIVEYK